MWNKLLQGPRQAEADLPLKVGKDLYASRAMLRAFNLEV
jgi:hypothetical protein